MSREQAAAELRARIGAHEPSLLPVIEALKETFGARLTFISVGGVEIGSRKEFDQQGEAPLTKAHPRGDKRPLKEREAEHITEALEAGGRAGRGAYTGRRPRVGRGA